MTNQEKYDNAFVNGLELTIDDLSDNLAYESVPNWDSVGHMSLIAELEDAFDIMMETDDIIDFSSYSIGKKILTEKYGVSFD